MKAQSSCLATRCSQRSFHCATGRSCRGSSTATHSMSPGAVVIVGDIGGTNARLSVWRTGDTAVELFAKTYPTANHPTFECVMDELLAEPSVVAAKPQAAALAIAGAVENDYCDMTNLDWIVDGPALQKKFGIRVALLNDFEAVGYGIPVLADSDVMVLNAGSHKSKAPKVVMGPGTGLGAAQLMWDSGSQAYKVWAGEGAHATFAPRGWKQQALHSYATSKLGHVEIEQVACGSGLELIYEFLLSDEVANCPILLKDAKPKVAADISRSAEDGSDKIAVEAVDMFLAVVGAEAGAMALRCLAKGGVYLAGGITPKLMQRTDAKDSLMEGFLNPKLRSKFHDILAATPLYVITNDKVGQIGAREFARSLVLIR